MVEDYPRTLLEFQERFATEDACREYLIELRWPDGFECPQCGHRKAWQITRKRYLRIIMIMNTHSYDREHLLYSRIG